MWMIICFTPLPNNLFCVDTDHMDDLHIDKLAGIQRNDHVFEC